MQLLHVVLQIEESCDLVPHCPTPFGAWCQEDMRGGRAEGVASACEWAWFVQVRGAYMADVCMCSLGVLT